MKTNILIFILFSGIQGFAQTYHYDYDGMPIKPKCSCGMGAIFKSNQREMPYVPLAISSRCKHYVPPTNNIASAPEDFYLFKRKKKRPQPIYPKTSSITRF